MIQEFSLVHPEVSNVEWYNERLRKKYEQEQGEYLNEAEALTYVNSLIN